MEYAYFYGLDEKGTSEFIDGYEAFKKRYNRNVPVPQQCEPGSILMTFSACDEFYFHDVRCRRSSKSAPLEFDISRHLGTFRDSILIISRFEHVGEGVIDIRFFPRYSIDFYKEEVAGMPWYIQNIGRSTLIFKTKYGYIKVSPNMRKRVCAENVEKDVM
jgi:hypothetical protein